MAKAKIIGTSSYAPGAPITNEELYKMVSIDFDIERLEGKIGIKQRHMAKLRGIEEFTTDFATKAAQAAIANAGIDPMEVGLFIVGTDSPQHICPGSAVMVQGRIQGQQMLTGCFDVNASCSSFTSALAIASNMMAGDATIKYAVVIGVYNMPAFVRPDDGFGHALFADGAGAVVLQRTDDTDISGFITSQLMSDGTQWDFMGIYCGGTKYPITHERLDKGEYGLQALKPLPGDRNVKLWPGLVEQLTKKVGLKVQDVDHVIFTQINKAVIEQVMEILGLPIEKTTMIMDRYGYTGSACIPMALHEAATKGKLKKGDKVALIASGVGFSVACDLIAW